MTDTVQTQTAPAKSPRLVGIDVVRLLAILAIVAVHSVAQFRYQIDVIGIIDNCGRFVVPFFFLVSGFFIGRRNPPALLVIKGLAVRLLPVFLFWVLVYLVLLGMVGQLFTDPLFIFKCLYYGGPAFHLWFLPALGMSAALVMLTNRLGLTVQIMIAVTLYAIGLITHPYAVMLGLPKFPVLTETGPFFGYLFVLLGYRMGLSNWIPPLRTGFMMLLTGMMFQLYEAYMIFTTGNGPFSPHTFLMGTILLGLGGFTLSLHIKPFPGSASIAKVGQVGLGMYCVHPIFLHIFQPYFEYNKTLDYAPVILLTFVASAIFSLIVARIPYLRAVVK